MESFNRGRIIPLLCVLISVWIIALIPFRIIGYGFLPPDDALRHSAKVISGKDWNQILVLRDDIKMDSHPGWHAILGAVHRLMHWDAHSLVIFSIISLFLLFAFTPLLFLRYPESWLITLILLAIFTPGWLFRLSLGRPYIFTMAVLLAICFLWPSLKNKKTPFKTVIFLTFAIAMSTWIHCAWYLFILPIAAFLLAREWRAGIVFSVCAVLGVIIGASLTGHPVIFLRQTIMHLVLAFSSADTQNILVTEFQPALVDIGIVVMIAGMIGWRALRGKWDKKCVDNPVFILAASSLVLTLISTRVFMDWGLPAIAVWLASEFDELLKIPHRRIAISAIACLVLYLAITSDARSRWSGFNPIDYLSAEDPDQKAWLPDAGGIIYSDDMGIFYSTFYKNPHAGWRYILGFEPGIMPPDDLATLRTIQKNFHLYKYFYPWVKKMRPQDRLIIRGAPSDKPKIPELEWYYAAHWTWSGRLPRKNKN
jgi:hypothetical protein